MPPRPCRPGAARQLLRPSATQHGRIEDTRPARLLLSIYLFPSLPLSSPRRARASATPPVSYPAREDKGYGARSSATICRIPRPPVSYYLSMSAPPSPCRPGAARQLVPDIQKNPARQLLRASATPIILGHRIRGPRVRYSARQLPTRAGCRIPRPPISYYLSIPPPVRVGRAPRVSYSARQLPGKGGYRVG